MLAGWRREAIRTPAELADFIATRSAQVGQAALYGYLKTRMGTQYRMLFQDPAFSAELAVARDRVVAACLADLTIFTLSLLPEARRHALGTDLFEQAADLVFDDLPDYRFDLRQARTDWAAIAEGDNAFCEGAAVLVAAAPVTQQFREADRETVENSLRFRWIEVRRQLRARLDPAAL